MIRTTALTLAIAAATLSMPAHAQFGKLKDLAGAATGTSSSSASSAAAPDEAAQEALVRRFVSSQSHSLQAQTSFARAFGLAEQVQLLEAERQAAQPELNAESKQHYAEGLVSLLSSAAEAQKLGGEASNFTAGMKNLGATQLATVGRKLAAGAWVAKESPGFIQGLYGSTKSAVTFAKKSKVKVPSNADSMLDSL